MHEQYLLTVGGNREECLSTCPESKKLREIVDMPGKLGGNRKTGQQNYLSKNKGKPGKAPQNICKSSDDVAELEVEMLGEHEKSYLIFLYVETNNDAGPSGRRFEVRKKARKKITLLQEILVERGILTHGEENVLRVDFTPEGKRAVKGYIDANNINAEKIADEFFDDICHGTDRYDIVDDRKEYEKPSNLKDEFDKSSKNADLDHGNVCEYARTATPEQLLELEDALKENPDYRKAQLLRQKRKEKKQQDRTQPPNGETWVERKSPDETIDQFVERVYGEQGAGWLHDDFGISDLAKCDKGARNAFYNRIGDRDERDAVLQRLGLLKINEKTDAKLSTVGDAKELQRLASASQRRP